jgi:hypothetical protein
VPAWWRGRYGVRMSFRPADRIFVDESKARGYYVVATAAASASVHAAERTLRKLLKPGQYRIHFKSEKDSRRRFILARMCELDVRSSVWIVKQLPDKTARPLCLTALVGAAVNGRAAQLTLERDDSLEARDRQLIAGVLRREGGIPLQYGHAAPREHPLLWVSDAVAWCYSNGGDWVRRCDAIVNGRVTLLKKA